MSGVELNTEPDIARSPVTTQPAKVSVRSGKCALEFPLGAARSKLIGGATVGSEPQAGIEPVEIRVIEEIEHFRTELNAVLLPDLPILGQRKINVLQPWLSHEATFQITELPGSRKLECGWIEIYRLVGTVEIDGHARNEVRAEASGGVTIQAKILATDARLNVERCTTK